MRASELLGVAVRDASGVGWGVVVDVLVDVPDEDRTSPAWDVSGVVVAPPTSGSAWAHFTGLAYGRQTGPWPLTLLGSRAAHESWFVPSRRVVSWSDEGLVVESGAVRTLEEQGL